MKPERVFEISLESQPSNTITRFSFYFSCFFPPPRLNITSLFKKLVNKCSRLHENCPRGQERAPHDPSPPFKEKEKGGEGGSKAWWPMEGSKGWWPMEGSKLGGHWKDPKLGGQWKVPSLVAIGRFQAWWPLEGSKLGGHWNVKDKHIFTSSIFPQQLYLHPQFFPLTSRFYFTMVLSRYSRLSFLFFEL